MIKRRRINETSEQNVANKKKLSLTQLEDLSNELIYELFEYFDYCSIYEMFVNLNTRFQSLFLQFSLPLKINFSLTSKSICQHRCKHIITPNIKRIISLNVSKHFLQFFSMNLFSSLQSLIISQIQSDQILLVLTHLLVLPHLFSLTIHSLTYFQDENSIYLAIFRLPQLKFCKLTFSSGGERVPLPLVFNPYQTLERLIINGHCRLEQLSSILSYLPALQHLSCEHLYGSECRTIEVPMNFRSLGLTCYRISFNDLKFFLSKVSAHLKTLRIKKSNNDDYIHAEQWEQLILNFMPRLCVFDLQYSVEIHDDSRQILINGFSSNFWMERQWFFDYYQHKKDSSCYLNFFSVVSYRHDQFILYEPIDNSHRPKSYENNHINYARRLTIDGYWKANKYSIQFPRVTQLTLRDNNIKKNPSFIYNVESMIRLVQITELCFKDNDISMRKLIELVYLLPNLRCLTLSNISILGLKQLDITESLSIQSKTTKVIIDDDEWQLEHVHFLSHVFPYLEYLEISINENHFEGILRVLLSKFKYLFSLFLLNVNYDSSERIQTLITNEKLLHNYSIERIQGGLYLWW